VILLLLQVLAAPETLVVAPLADHPVLDGAVSASEWGTPSLEIARAQGPVRVWLRHDSAAVYLAAALPDSTYYWGDDLVISLDVDGDRSAGPDHDDFQWYLRRVLDSSLVLRGQDGHWQPPRGDPDWRLGPEREGGGWRVWNENTSSGWSIELRFDREYFSGQDGRLPGFSVRVYDDAPHGWTVWPRASDLPQPTEVERRPRRWGVVRLGSP